MGVFNFKLYYNYNIILNSIYFIVNNNYNNKIKYPMDNKL